MPHTAKLPRAEQDGEHRQQRADTKNTARQIRTSPAS
jgi:hypothetical protein